MLPLGTLKYLIPSEPYLWKGTCGLCRNTAELQNNHQGAVLSHSWPGKAVFVSGH